MKHRVRIHGKKPKTRSPRRQAKKPAPEKKFTSADVVKGVRHRAWPAVLEALAGGVHPEGIHIHGDPLILAVAAIGPVRVVQAVLKAGADPNAENPQRKTPLFVARDPAVARKLLEAGADPNHVSRHGATALHDLAAHGHDKALQVLLEAGAHVDPRDDEGRTPLMLAVEHLRLPAVQVLLDHRADPNVRDREGNTLLHQVVRQRSKAALALVQMLLAAGAEPDARTREHFTPLLLAATDAAARLLVEAGADVNAATRNHVTPLVLAIHRGDVATARLLIHAKARPDIRVAADYPQNELAGRTARELAAASSHRALRDLFRA